MATLYERDFHAWALDQAKRLRQGESVDIENIAEELETLGRLERSTLRNRLAVLLQYLLMCEFQPEKHTKMWDATIKEQRRQVNRLLSETQV